MNSLLKFEALLESEENKLTGGFSSSVSSTSLAEFTTSNNCHGSNCAPGCEEGRNYNCTIEKTSGGKK